MEEGKKEEKAGREEGKVGGGGFIERRWGEGNICGKQKNYGNRKGANMVAVV